MDMKTIIKEDNCLFNKELNGFKRYFKEPKKYQTECKILSYPQKEQKNIKPIFLQVLPCN